MPAGRYDLEVDAGPGFRSDLLAVLTPDARAALVQRLKQRSYRRGHVLFNDGDSGDRLYLLAAGRLEVEVTTVAGQCVVVRVVQPGELVGELALVHEGYRRTGRVTALEDAVTHELRRTDFEELRAIHPEVDRFLVATLAKQVVDMTALVTELVQPPEVRIWSRLGVLADAYGDDPIRLSQEALAHATGTVRQTVNRVLQVGVRAGVIALERGSVRVLDRAALDRLERDSLA